MPRAAREAKPTERARRSRPSRETEPPTPVPRAGRARSLVFGFGRQYQRDDAVGAAGALGAEAGWRQALLVGRGAVGVAAGDRVDADVGVRAAGRPTDRARRRGPSRRAAPAPCRRRIERVQIELRAATAAARARPPAAPARRPRCPRSSRSEKRPSVAASPAAASSPWRAASAESVAASVDAAGTTIRFVQRLAVGVEHAPRQLRPQRQHDVRDRTPPGATVDRSSSWSRTAGVASGDTVTA